MFEELMHSIWEEFSKLVFHAEIEIDPSQVQEGVVRRQRRRRADRARLLRRHPEGAALGAAAGRRGGSAAPKAAGEVAGGGGNGAAAPEAVETVVKDEHDKEIGRNDPCWCGQRQEVQEVPRRLRAR